MSSQGWDENQAYAHALNNNGQRGYPQQHQTNGQQVYHPGTGSAYYPAIPQQYLHAQQVPLVGTAHPGMIPVQQSQQVLYPPGMHNLSQAMSYGREVHPSPAYSQSSTSTQLGSESSHAGTCGPVYGHSSQVPRLGYRRRTTERSGGVQLGAPDKRMGGDESDDDTHGTVQPDGERKSKRASGPGGLSVHSQRKTYVYGLEGYITESQDVLRQNSVDVPQPKRAATSTGVSIETRNDMLARMSETADALQTAINQKEASIRSQEPSPSSHKY